MFDKLFATVLMLKLNAGDWIEAGNEEGATMVEYGLMVVGIAVVVAAAALALGGRISALFDTVIP